MLEFRILQRYIIFKYSLDFFLSFGSWQDFRVVLGVFRSMLCDGFDERMI